MSEEERERERGREIEKKEKGMSILPINLIQNFNNRNTG